MRFPFPCLLIVLTLAACDNQAGLPQIITTPQYPHLAFIAPPPPIREDVPVILNPRKETWRPGYWAFENNNFNWVPGAVMPLPSPWAVWSPDHWVQHTYGWAFVPGTWQ